MISNFKQSLDNITEEEKKAQDSIDRALKERFD